MSCSTSYILHIRNRRKDSSDRKAVLSKLHGEAEVLEKLTLTWTAKVLQSRAESVSGYAVSFVLAARSTRQGSCHISASVSQG
jgi:hypothetical protein